jgi:molybdenum-dependent DNA-binding transcriptional regulator ModE
VVAKNIYADTLPLYNIKYFSKMKDLHEIKAVITEHGGKGKGKESGSILFAHFGVGKLPTVKKVVELNELGSKLIAQFKECVETWETYVEGTKAEAKEIRMKQIRDEFEDLKAKFKAEEINDFLESLKPAS